MRSTRHTLCRRFGPSPCPTHYGRRWANTPSADCCAITPRRYHRVRCRMVVGSGGRSSAFAMALSPAPLTINCDLRVRWPIQAFQPGPQFDSHSHTGRLLHSSPRIRTCAFGAQPPHLPYPRTPRASSYGADSPQGQAFYAVPVRRLAPLHSGFLQTIPHGLALALGWWLS